MACSPFCMRTRMRTTGDGVTTRRADRAAPWTAARSLENGFLPAASESSPRRVGHVSASGAPPRESELDGQPGIRFPTPPSSSETTALIRGFNAYKHWPRELRIKLPHLVAFVH